jgi:hypothetical protein
MPIVPETRRPKDFVQRRPLTSTSLAFTSVFDDEERDLDYQPSDAYKDTDGAAPLGGKRYSASKAQCQEIATQQGKNAVTMGTRKKG